VISDLEFGIWDLGFHVVFNHPVPNMNRPVRERGDVGFVRDEDDGVAGGVQPGEERHDFGAGLGIEVSGRLVREQD
jgi:hypothetical protein